jgi:hypothetical protein
VVALRPVGARFAVALFGQLAAVGAQRDDGHVAPPKVCLAYWSTLAGSMRR